MSVQVVAKGDLDEQAKAHLAALHEALRANPLLRYNNPDLGPVHEKQIAFHGAKTRVKVYTGGTRAGKSFAGIVDNLIQCLPRDWVPEHLLKFKRKDPPFKCRIIVPDLLQTLAEIQEAIREWIPPSQLKGGSWKEAYRTQEKILKLECGSQIDFKSYEADIDKFGSVSLDRVHFDEEPPHEKGEQIYKQSLRRVLDRQGDILLTATPEFGLSWTATEFWDNRGPEVSERIWKNDWLTIVRATTHDNPFVPRDELSESRMTEEEYKTKVLGEWFHPKGLVFDELDPDRHIVSPASKEHVKGLSTIVGIDPGYRTTAVVFIGFDADNCALVYDELYLHEDGALPEPTCEQIKLVLRRWGVTDAYFVIDPVARNASLQTGYENVQSAYQRAGVPAIPANNKVEAGILEVKRRLQSKLPALLVSSTCLNWQKERDRYRLDDKEDGQFAVVKRNDHLMDATRYVCMERTWHQEATPEKNTPTQWVPGTAPSMDWINSFPGENTSPPLGSMT